MKAERIRDLNSLTKDRMRSQIGFLNFYGFELFRFGRDFQKLYTIMVRFPETYSIL
jgi:hypothetical protein